MNLFETRKKLEQEERKTGISHLSTRTRAVLEFIIFNDNASITDIRKEPYFREWSFSTIKRDVLRLKADGLVQIKVSEEDSRVKKLSVKI